ncbi:MAG: hypothetical protein LQ346_007116 [Caloplaca aetnensis]|nr:MAG: hypothetical protein LQ346_007116 [Caloplaca aetnensis]
MALPAANTKFERFKDLLYLCLGDDEISEQGIESLCVFLERSCPNYDEKIDLCRRFVALVIPKIPEGMLKDFTTRYAGLLEELTENEKLRNTNLGDFVREIRRHYPGGSADVCRCVMNHVLELRDQDTQAPQQKPTLKKNKTPTSGSVSAPAQYPHAGSEEGEITTTPTRTHEQPEITVQAGPALHNDDTLSQNFSTISLRNQVSHEECDTTFADATQRSNSLKRHQRQAEDWVDTTITATLSPIQPTMHEASKTGQPAVDQPHAARPQEATQGSLRPLQPSDNLAAFAVNPQVPRPGQLFTGRTAQSQNVTVPFGSFRDYPALSNQTKASKTKRLLSRANPEPTYTSINNMKGINDASRAALGPQIESSTINRDDSKTSQSDSASLLAIVNEEVPETFHTLTPTPLQVSDVLSYTISNATEKFPLLKEEPDNDAHRLNSLTREPAIGEIRKRSDDIDEERNKKFKVSTYHAPDVGQRSRRGRRPAPAAKRVNRRHAFPTEIYNDLTRNPYLVFENVCPFALSSNPCPWGANCRLLRRVNVSVYDHPAHDSNHY